MEVSEKVFTRVISNLIIVILILVIFFTGFAGTITSAISIQQTNKPIYNGNRDKNIVSLMINIYWGNEYIENMLNTLDRYNVKATFFIGGMWAEKYPDILKDIHNRGHEIGNHGYFHKSQDKMDFNGNKEEIFATQSVIKNILGIETNLFMPPSGAYCNATLDAAESLGYKTIMWSRDTIDWRDKNADIIFKRATKNISGGDMVLMHPTEATMKALPRIIEFYINNGFNVGIVSKNIE